MCKAAASPFHPYVGVVSRPDTQGVKISNIDLVKERGFRVLELFDLKIPLSNRALSYEMDEIFKGDG